MRAQPPEILNVPKAPFWFKVTGMLAQNWAMVCEEVGGPPYTACIYFFDDHGEVFDALSYPTAAQADHALEFNGFTPLDDEPGFRAIAGEPQFPLTLSARNARPVYSSGEYWHPPPHLDRVTTRRSITAAGLDRFIQAQNPIYEHVLCELTQGKKTDPLDVVCFSTTLWAWRFAEIPQVWHCTYWRGARVFGSSPAGSTTSRVLSTVSQSFGPIRRRHFWTHRCDEIFVLCDLIQESGWL